MQQSGHPSKPATNEALAPLPADRRVFRTIDHAALWFSLGVGLLVMQVGSFLIPALSMQQALLAIVLGSLIGAGLLGWVAKIASDSGLASAGLMHTVYGRRFASLPILLNIVQLIGWGTFELVVMRDATVAIGRQSGVMKDAWWPILATLIWGGAVVALISGSMVQLVRKVIARVALPLVVLSLLWLTWQFLAVAFDLGIHVIWDRPGQGGMGVMSALDLVIAMPISWLPLVADYARHGKTGQGALRGTWIGYAIANVWCYALGVLVALVLPSADLVTALLLAQGGLIAVSLILIDEVDNAYGDVYSGAVSTHSLLPRWGVRSWGMVVALACTGMALVLPMHSLEPFLLMLSSVFVPLFGVILGRLAFGANTQKLLEDAGNVHIVPVIIWIAGIACYHLLPLVLPALGSAIPTLVICFVATRLLVRTR
ncbi:allantoin permease [Diaphorobacter sp. HDW4A]|uniref:purine-cytosine permease family protein n=1 Tax=Diaphorobacter sp. HDW4A TaxID=2714924 RepID=UPI00140900C4|nr:cytosine permease [Diaphorobacter sp. HDW4A]QIL80469.1 allantoin permease [Diaphorobacter sp. HDW4A]